MQNYSEIFHPDRYFDSDPAVREIARTLYSGVKELPIVCPHGHVDPKIFAENAPFPDPAELFIKPDHYVFRMLYSQGIALEDLGVPTIDGSFNETDPRKIWQIFAENFHLFRGTPSGVWLTHEFADIFGITERLNGGNAQEIYDRIQQKLSEPVFLPRTLFDQFKIEVLTTTDGATDTLEYHKQIAESDWNGKDVPCFRPDALFKINSGNWLSEIDRLSDVSGEDVVDFKSFILAIENRRDFFAEMGAVSTDQGVTSPLAHELSGEEVESLFQKAMAGDANELDEEIFSAHMLMEMARMSVEDGLVMQIHPGSFRNHNEQLFERFGPDKGSDIPIQTEFTRNLYELLNKFGNDSNFSLILFTLDETTYSRELAPLAGHYPAVKLGPAWWFHDSIEGMTRYRKMVTETAGIYNTAGFNDDTRAFLSIPARHDLSRRIDCNFLADMVARHLITFDEAKEMSEELAYKLVKKSYKI